MPFEFVGDGVSIGKDKTGEIILSYSRDAEIVEILTKSTGRVAITSLNLVGVEEFITGELELDLLKKDGNVYTLIEPVAYPKEAKVVIGLTNISTQDNLVYIALVMKY